MISKDKILNIKNNFKKIIVNFITNNKILFFSLVLITIGYLYNIKNIKKQIEVNQDNNKEDYINLTLYNKDVSGKKKYLLNNFDYDFVIGDEKASIIFVDYSSFSCRYCLEMRKDINRIIDEYALQNKIIKYVFRPVFNTKTIKLKILLDCIDNYDKKKALIDKIFSIEWNKIKDMNLAIDNLLLDVNLKKDKIKNCLGKEENYSRAVFYQKESSVVFDIRKAPLIIINGKGYFGFKNYNDLKKIIEENVKKN